MRPLTPFSLIARLCLPVCLALTACQSVPTTTTPGQGIVVVKARTQTADRRVQALRPRPVKANQIQFLRVSLVNLDTLDVLEQEIASPGADVSLAFRNLHAETNYRVEARAFNTVDGLGNAPANGLEVASDAETLTILNETTPVLANMVIDLGDVTFDAQMTATGVSVLEGGYDTAATITAGFDYDQVTTLAGGQLGGVTSTAGDPGLGNIFGMAEAGGKLYLADNTLHTIWELDPVAGSISSAYGVPAISNYSEDSTGTGVAHFNTMTDVVADGLGHLYVADRNNNVIRKIDLATGITSKVVGQVGVPGYADSPATPALLSNVSAMAYASDALYFTDELEGTVRMVDLTTLAVTTVAGAFANPAGYQDGTASDALFRDPSGIAVRYVGGDRHIYVADTGNHLIRKIVTSGGVTNVSTFAGDYVLSGGIPQGGYANGTGTAARFNWPCGLTFDPSGNLYVADTDNHRIRRITPQGGVTTYAGNGLYGVSDGPQKSARMTFPQEVLWSGSTLYFFEDEFRRVGKIE